MVRPVGIDLGTTNSVISYYHRGRPETLKVDGKITMPSAVCFRDKRTTIVGVSALNMAMIRPESTILSTKRHMGDRNHSYKIHDNVYTPIDISAMILEKLCEGHDEALGGAPRDAVITVPAYFTDAQRQHTLEAGEKAGLNVLRLLPEPTAAAIAIGLDKGRDQTILVYDLGGGTFDVSILKIVNNDFQVQAVNGDHDLGGNDFDQLLRDHVVGLFHAQHGIDLSKQDRKDPEVSQSLQKMATACEMAKIELSDTDEAFIDLPGLFRGLHLEATVGRKTFESLIEPMIMRTKDVVLDTIKEAGMDVDDIDRLVMVGGSTKIPLVSDLLSKTVKEPFIADNVDLAVSHGAAIMAANLHAVAEAGSIDPDYAPIEIRVTDVAAHPISIGMTDEREQLSSVNVIAKNESLPATGMALGAAMPGQRMGQLPVFRGDEPDPENNQYLGLLTLTFDPSPTPTFVRFELLLNDSGVLQVEGSILDLEGRDPAELQWIDPATLRAKRKVRAEIKLPD